MDTQNKYKFKNKKYKNYLCDDKLTFEECELTILRNVIDKSEKMKGEKLVKNDEVIKIINIVENFIRKKKLICYGGTAINDILPKFAQFYDRDTEIPDYDFFSPNALDDAKELADIYFKEGYNDVEAKAGVHHGTYKVFVNFIPIADITFLNNSIFRNISKESVIINGIHYAPPNFLRMSMYLELSRPEGDLTRWEKVFKRINLLNKHYPLKAEKDCNTIEFQRKMDSDIESSKNIYDVVRDSFINQGVVFFGGYASNLYSKYMPEPEKNIIHKIPDFDVLSEDPEKTATILKENLVQNNFNKIKIIHHPSIDDLLPEHIEIRVDLETIAFIYKPLSCHSYNKITNNTWLEGKEVNVATIDTILSFYLVFIYTDKPYYDKDRLLCMANFLFDVEQKNRLEQKELLKRFTLNCYGKHETLSNIRVEKANKYKELLNKKNSREYEEWFLKYDPSMTKKSSHARTIKKDKKDKKDKKIKNVTKKNVNENENDYLF